MSSAGERRARSGSAREASGMQRPFLRRALAGVSHGKVRNRTALVLQIGPAKGSNTRLFAAGFTPPQLTSMAR